MAVNLTHALIWDRPAECMSLEERRQVQLKRLQDLVERLNIQSPFYRQRFLACGVRPADIRTLDDLRRLPFTEKDDLRQSYPFGLFTVPVKDVVRIHCSSGTTGKPVVSGYTARDMETWNELMARSYTGAGVTARDIVHNAFGYGLFTGGLGFDRGGRKIGAAVVPMSGGTNDRQVMLMEDFGATVLTCTPSYALVLAETAEKMGVDVRSGLKLRVCIYGAEPSTVEIHGHIERSLGVEAFETYGLGEVMGPGVSFECSAHEGLHLQDDHFLPEIIDPDTGEVLPPGGQGELVITTLTKEAMPLVRYRTRDITRLNTAPCPCGRTTVRHAKLAGRTDDMLVIKGVNVFPSQVESVLLRHGELAPHYVLMVDRINNLDSLEIQVEAGEELHSRGEEHIEHLAKQLRHEMQQVLYISSSLSIVPPYSIQRTISGKVRRVIDRRKERGQI